MGSATGMNDCINVLPVTTPPVRLYVTCWLCDCWNACDLQFLQVLEDVSEEHARKTVTVEAFPHDTSLVAAAIHPCKHAVTMKKLGSMMEQGGRSFTVDQ